jgi:hypothetical protein
MRVKPGKGFEQEVTEKTEGIQSNPIRSGKNSSGFPCFLRFLLLTVAQSGSCERSEVAFHQNDASFRSAGLF